MSYLSTILVDAPWSAYALSEADASHLAQDSSGNGRHSASYGNGGNITFGEPTLIVGGAGCMKFTAVGAADVAFTGLAGMAASEYSVEAWVKGPGVAGADVQLVWNGDSSPRFFQFRIETGNALGFIPFDSGGGAHSMAGAKNVCDGQVHHLVATYSTLAGDAKIYVDGVSDASPSHFAITPPSGSPDSDLAIYGGSTHPFVGWLQWAAFYQTALPAARVLAHYQAGIGISSSDILVAHSVSAALRS